MWDREVHSHFFLQWGYIYPFYNPSARECNNYFLNPSIYSFFMPLFSQRNTWHRRRRNITIFHTLPIPLSVKGSININLLINTLSPSFQFCVILYRNTQRALTSPISIAVVNIVQFEPFKEENYPFHRRTRCVPRSKLSTSRKVNKYVDVIIR